MLQQPACAALRHQSSQPVVGIGIRIQGKSFFQHGLEFRRILSWQACIFGEGNIGAGALPLGQLDGAVEVLAHELLLLRGGDARARRFESDEELGHGAVSEALVELGDAPDHGLHQRQIGDRLGAVLRKRNGQAARGGGPVEQWHVAFADALERGVGILIQGCAEPGMPGFEAAHAVPIGAQVELAGALAEGVGAIEALALGFVDARIDERIGVFRKALSRRQQKPGVLGRFGEQALVRFQSKGDGGGHQVGIVVAGERRAARGQRVAHLVHRHSLDGATGPEDQQNNDHERFHKCFTFPSARSGAIRIPRQMPGRRLRTAANTCAVRLTTRSAQASGRFR